MFNVDQARMFINDIQYQRSSYYYYIGGITPWNGLGGNFVGDIRPDGEVGDTPAINREYRSEMMFIKKISPPDVSLMMKKIIWETGVVYDQYDHTKEMKDLDFFVVNSENRVYKCLFNNGDSPSINEPNFRTHLPTKLADGYIWKYMYEISPFKERRFRSADYLPVQRAMTDSFYNNGIISDVIVTNQGSNYVDVLQTQIFIDDTGHTTGTGAAGTIVAANGVITDVDISNGGTGYTAGAKITIEGDTGSGAILEPVIDEFGEIIDVIVLNGGLGYTNAHPITVSVGGAALLPVVSRISNSIIDVKIINSGIGYITPPSLTVWSSGDVGSGLYDGNLTALFDIIIHEGQIAHVNTIDPGQNYSFDTDTTISVNGDGEGAVFTPVVNEGRIIDVVIENAGTGYNEILLTVNSAGNSGSGATLVGIIGANDYRTDQSIIEQLPAKGLYAVKMISTGDNYSRDTTATITGNGTGAICVPVIENGHILGVNITNYGTNYTWAEISFSDSNRPYIPEEEIAHAYVIIPPSNGHGYNAPVELFGNIVAIVTPVRSELEEYDIVQDFRIFGIIKNPNFLLTNTRFMSQHSLIAFVTEFDSTTELIVDEVLQLGLNKFKVLSIKNNNVYLISLDNNRELPSGTLTSVIGGRQYVSTVISSPDVDKYSGDLLTISLENPFTFSQEQNLSLKTFLQF